MTQTLTEKYWRLRIKFNGVDLSRDAWERNEVGIWYGAWSASDLKHALETDKPGKYLGDLPAQDRPSPSQVATARRFAQEVTSQDWVVVFFDDTLHLARVCSEVSSEEAHPLNRGNELFKYRKITTKKFFRLSRLIDSYRLIPSAGWSNVHQYNSTTNRHLLELLANSSSEEDVNLVIKGKSIHERLEMLGPSGWESLCLGYLILEEGFLPTGLRVGGTLRALDIVGRSRGDRGDRILAQCKKDNGVVDIGQDFLETAKDLLGKAKVYYFAYGGCRNAPEGVRVMSGSEIERWGETEKGRSYFTSFFGA